MTKLSKIVPLLLLIAAPGPGQKQPDPTSGPSLEETLSWLKTKVESAAGYSVDVTVSGRDSTYDREHRDHYYSSHTYVSVSAQGCGLSWADRRGGLNGSFGVSHVWEDGHEYTFERGKWRKSQPNDDDPESDTESSNVILTDLTPDVKVTRVEGLDFMFGEARQPWDSKFKGDLAYKNPKLDFTGTFTQFWVRALSSDGRKEVKFAFSDEALAGRVAKALAHAIELCGGKLEPF